jgi:hypothetical protein
MNRYGAKGQPCLTDLDSLKSFPISPLTLIKEEASRYKEETHFIHLGLQPSLDKVGKRNPHLILSKAFSKSRRSRTRSYPFSIAHSRDSWTRANPKPKFRF